MSNYEQKSGHPVLGIILGILGIVAALFLCLLTGVIGGVIAGILGLAAVLTGMAARKGGKGIGAIVAGALAIILAVVLTVGSVRTFQQIQEGFEHYIEYYGNNYQDHMRNDTMRFDGYLKRSIHNLIFHKIRETVICFLFTLIVIF